MPPNASLDAESRRLADDAARRANWKRWGPYLSERQWGTVREDYSADGNCWDYFPHEHARSRAYRWGEDGLLGFTDRQCRVCFALALWNGKDPILKERLFGLTNAQGNHGEDAKELWHYLESSPTHAYTKALYRYPHSEFPYQKLIDENARRSKKEPEYELEDTGVFAEDRFFDVVVETAKATPDDVLIRIRVHNRGPDPARLHVLPTVWFRNLWSWGCSDEGCDVRPTLRRDGAHAIAVDEPSLEPMWLAIDEPGHVEALFTENETNTKLLFGAESATRHVKDAFHERVVGGRVEAVNPLERGTKGAFWKVLEVEAGGSRELRLRFLPRKSAPKKLFGPAFDEVFATRISETHAYYETLNASALTDEEANVQTQAYAGLLWSKQFYHYSVDAWLKGDDGQPRPPASRNEGRNRDWRHLYNRDVISMPDKWEYPWYAAWDLAFHMIPMSRVDPEFAKDQLVLFLREWYMHPSGQIPAYEFNFSDVNPPVHAWACWRVYKMTAPRGKRDRVFLARCFQKLLINFTWWVNRKDPQGRHLFAGGFLGLDNIGVFDRSRPLPGGAVLEQADGTAWMAFYCATMLAMALELAQGDPAYEDVASKFFEHFVAIVDAMNTLGGTGLWNEDDGFYYDQMRHDGRDLHLRVRSMVGLVPLLAAEVLEPEVFERLPYFAKRTRWFLEHRRDLADGIAYLERDPQGNRTLLAVPSRARLERVLARVFDEREFLSPFGLRSLSRAHLEAPFRLVIGGEDFVAEYEPGETSHRIFGGNSNWRGPIWFPLNYLLIESLRRYHYFYRDTLTVEVPTGSGRRLNLDQAADELEERLVKLFVRGEDGQRPCHGPRSLCTTGSSGDHLVLFHEYFHGDDGRGLGASHQTGWTALVTRCIESVARARAARQNPPVPKRPAPRSTRTSR